MHWEDGQSAALKLRLVEKYGLGGAFFWSLGRDDPAVWPVTRQILTTD